MPDWDGVYPARPCRSRRRSIVAAGALVLANTVIEPHTLWGGVPAKFIKEVDPAQSKELNQKIANGYLMYASWFKEEETEK